MTYSIITPVYNRADCISRCIDSVCAQLTFKDINIEHIIVDDASTDTTASIIKTYVNQFQHIKFISFNENRGTNAARNAAIRMAKGEFCILLDSDDYFVHNALQIINETINLYPKYKYYLFAPDDKMTFFNTNPSLKDINEKELTYIDFLAEKVNTDYIHVCTTDIMKKYPFDESLRIYEGVFFLRFYKEAQKIFFKKEIVAIRERSRDDSVTRSVLRIEKTSISKSIKSSSLFIEWFKKDYINNHLMNRFQFLLNSIFQNQVLLGNYKEAQNALKEINKYNLEINYKFLILYLLRLGGVTRILLRYYLIIKYNLLHKKLR